MVFAAVCAAVSVGVWALTGSLLFTVLSAAVVVLVAWLLGGILVGSTGATVGKGLTGLRVLHEATGTPIGIGAALLRSLVLGLATVPTFGLGLATLAWTAVSDPSGQRRGWHDHLTGAVVLDIRPGPESVTVTEPSPRHVVNLTAMRLVPAEPGFAIEAPRPVLVPPVVPSPPAPNAATSPLPIAPAPVGRPADAGRTVARGAHPVPAEFGPGPEPTWRVVFDSGETFVVAGLTLIGRSPEARRGESAERLVALPSPQMSVSKTHAQVSVAGDGVLVLLDRGSTNGTVLFRSGISKPVSPGRATTLLPGDRVRFGDREMTVIRES